MASIDVFGQQLIRYTVPQRGPPGVGFRFTVDGNYDLEAKRLCFVANPERPTDAATLQTVQDIVQNVSIALNQQLNDLEAKLQNFERVLNRIEEDGRSAFMLSYENAKFISNLDGRLQTLERNELQRNGRERAT